MQEYEEPRVPDHGPWQAELDLSGNLLLSSDDFHHDVQLRVTGDFGDVSTKRGYGQFLARLLTQGGHRARAAAELADPAELLTALEQAARGPHSEVLQQAADELARLRCALADAEAVLLQLQAHRHVVNRVREAQAPSAFAHALTAALNVRANPTKGAAKKLDDETAQPASPAVVEQEVVRAEPQRASTCGLTECRNKPECLRCEVVRLEGAPREDDAHAIGAAGGPAHEGERAAFEAWMRGHCWALGATWTGTGYLSDREGASGGNYVCPLAMQTRRLWAAWRDRAALARRWAPNRG